MTRRALLPVVVAVAVVLSTLALSPAQATHTPNGELLPDLETREPSDLVVDTVAGERVLRFSNTVGNHHTGVMEVFNTRGVDCDNDGDAENNRQAYQRIYRDANGNGAFDRGVDPESRTAYAGCMQYHPTHSHWHFDAFAEYRLYQINRGIRGRLIGSSRKTSFCIGDLGPRLWPDLPGSPVGQHYTSCDRTSVQGLSVGWSDTYQYYLDGQHVALPANLFRGQYCLVSIADPENRLVETDNGDNEESVRVIVSGNWVMRQPDTNC